MFLVVAKDYIDKGFADPENTPEYQELYGGEVRHDTQEIWFYSREESSRLTWRPYMHDLTLPPGFTALNKCRSRSFGGARMRLFRSAQGRRTKKRFPVRSLP